MRWTFVLACTGWVLACGAVAGAMDARDLPLRSSGSETPDRAWTLDRNGFVGAYIRVEKPAQVNVAVHAAGAGGAQMSVVLADQRGTFAPGAVPQVHAHAFDLPAGTYLLRIELANHTAKNDSRLTIQRVEVSTATILSENTDALATEAANSYIQNFRKGEIVVQVPADIAKPGASARVKLRRHAFNFGGTIHGEFNLSLLDPNAPPDSDAGQFQKFVKSHFNLLVASNGGKWLYNERERGKVTMEFVDACFAFAKANGFRVRQHALLWDSANQQPKWVNDLIDTALNSQDPSAVEGAKKQLRAAISKRIDYYVRDPATNYLELDALNEPYHQPRYWKIFGPEGLADIFTEATRAARSAGSDAKLYLNEYNVFQWSSNALVKGAPLDAYANWYREMFEAVREAGGGIAGVGIQYYGIKNEPGADKGNPHSPARITQVLANLSVLGLPISLTEFGVQRQATPEQAADMLEDTMRLIFGADQCHTFIIWGFWGGSMWDMAPKGALVDRQWKLTPAGQRYEKLMKEWDTDQTVVIDADGRIAFYGFWGDYDVTLGERTFKLSTSKDHRSHKLHAE